MRGYEKTHPWINFNATEINQLGPSVWMQLGEARSKCQHLAGVPLKPAVAQDLYRVMLIHGVHATTAIEGNTLTEEQIAGIIDGTFKAPPSRQYQEQEVRNVIRALRELHKRIVSGERITLTADLICELNRWLLEGTDHAPEAIPGEIRKYSVGVASYRGAPWKDCEFLLGRLCEWLEGPIFQSDDPEVQFALIMLSAVLVHLYLAWIHPFGDGNGRTARLVEFAILARCGMVPLPAAHILSNHYNLTRDRYYRELEKASKDRGHVKEFISYAVQGFVDGIREAIDKVRDQQLQVAWVNFVHEQFRSEPNTKAADRQRSLVLSLPIGRWVPRQAIAGLDSELMAMYAPAGPRTLSRDLNHLASMGLISRRPGQVKANHELVEAFLPDMAPPIDS